MTDAAGVKEDVVQTYWIKELSLWQADRQCIEDNGWLNDNIIKVSQDILKKSHPNIGGLQSTMLGETLTYSIERGKFVQILHINNNHWITISNIFSKNGGINVYNSVPSKDLPDKAKKQIAALIHSPDTHYVLEFERMQRQRGASDCGLFAIAFATALCCGYNPAAVEFKQNNLRSHLIESFEKREIQPFPSKEKIRSRSLTKVSVALYCLCRLPESGYMIQCDVCQEWYHDTCIIIPKNINNIKWYCQPCME